MFYDHTNVYTSRISDLNISQGSLSESATNETEYQFSQITFVLASFFGCGSGQLNNQIQGSGLLYRIWSFL
ncbi:hypothetical protein [Trichormus sp. NMC-1]|uniref:hypothetical protein n=1 Tax=Trichormus sp. NMC-1 TaxID=1853259 RepID=UPI00115FE816|nr:hypothetical protein [Trichormus sp. NMC-1]